MVKKIITLWVALIMCLGLFNGCGKEDFVEVETHDMIELHTWFFTSGMPNNAIVFKDTNKSTVFECSVDNGNLKASSTQYVKNLVAKPDDTIYWQTDATIEQAFIEIILKIEDNIVGYAVIEILQNNTSVDYKASVCKSALIPKVNDEYQNVTEKQVKTAIEKAKTN